jgi:phosphoribosylformylglycinamidine synthase
MVACWPPPAEMAFAGHVGVALNVDMLVTEGDGISDSRMETGDAKNWAQQVSARREELTLKALFNEELGVVLQVRTAERNEVMQTLREHGLSKFSHLWARPARHRPASIDAARASCRSGAMPRPCSARQLADLHQVWDAVSWKICQQRDNPANAPMPSTPPRASPPTPACTCTSRSMRRTTWPRRS